MESTIQITIRHGACEVHWDPKQEMIFPMIGGLEHAKNVLLSTLYHGPQSVWTEQKQIEQSGQKRVSRDDALKYYFEVGKKLQERVQIIQGSDERATFFVDPILLHSFDIPCKIK